MTELIHAMGEMLFTPDAEKYEALSPYGQARLDTALRILLIAAAGQKRKEQRADLKVVEGGKG